MHYLLGDRHTSTRVDQAFIFASGEIEVCDGAYSAFVMNKEQDLVAGFHSLDLEIENAHGQPLRFSLSAIACVC